MLCTILYLENSDKARFSDLKKRVKNDYVLNKSEYLRMVTAVQILLLNYQPNYNSNRNYQYNKFRNLLMFAQLGKTGDDEGNGKKRSRDPGEIWTTSLATTVEKNVIIMGTMTARLNPGSNNVQRHSEK